MVGLLLVCLLLWLGVGLLLSVGRLLVLLLLLLILWLVLLLVLLQWLRWLVLLLLRIVPLVNWRACAGDASGGART